MSYGKYVLGLFLITLCSSGYGKTFNEYKREASAKTPSCQRDIEFFNKNFIPGKGYPTEELGLERHELHQLCESELRAYLPPEALALEQAEIKYYQEKSKKISMESFKKGYITEDELHEKGYNVDGTDRMPSWYESLYWKHKKEILKPLEAIGNFLLWPIMIISVLLGLFLITNPKGFTRMVFGLFGGIASLVFGKKTSQKDVT